MADICKYDELRRKTDIELVQLMNHELDRGIGEARRGLSAETWAVAQPYFLRAQRAQATASRLIALVGELANADRAETEGHLRQLREMLDGLAVRASVRTPSNDNIASLAHALWDARGCPEGSSEDDWFRAERTLKSQRATHAVCC